MLPLASTSDLVRVITSAAANVLVHASWVDNNSGTITPDRTNTAAITTATTTTVVGSPGASTQRNVRGMFLRNTHASVDTDVTVDQTDGTNAETIIKATLRAGDSLVMSKSGRWYHYDANARLY